MPLEAMLEGPKSFLDNQWQVLDYVAISIRLLFQFHSDDRFSRNYAMDTVQQEDSAPSAHESLEPLEARSLLIDEGEEGFSSVHHYNG